MKKMGPSTQGKKEVESVHGYWMYEDGSSTWGTGPFRGNDKPVMIPAEIHRKSPEEKKAWFAESKQISD